MTKSKPYHHGNLREALLEAAARLLREYGVAGLSLRDVARDAGVSHAAPYRHFPDKQALLAGLAETGFVTLREALQRVIERYPDDPRQQLIEAGAVYVALALHDPHMHQLMFGGALSAGARPPSLREAAESSYQTLLDVVENGVRAGLYRALPLAELAGTAWALMHGLAMLVSTGQLGDSAQANPSALARAMAAHLLDGLVQRD